MTESFPSSDPGAQKRRSTRIVHAVPLTVAGVDALGQPFKERTSTLIISCHGCKYQSKHYVPKNSYVSLEIPNPEAGRPPRTVQARVTWVQRPRTVRELFQVGAELQIPGNVWGVAFPPEDWFPYGEGVPAEAPAAPTELGSTEVAAPPTEPGEIPRIAPTAPPPPSQQPAAPSAAAPAPPVQPPSPPSAEETVRVVPFPGGEPSVPLTRQLALLLLEAKQQLQKAAREATATAVSEETSRLLGQLSLQMRAAAQEAVDAAASARIDEVMRQIQNEINEARQAGVRTLQDQWAQEAERAAKLSSQHLATRLVETAESYREKLAAQLEAELNQTIDRVHAFQGQFVSAAEAGQALAERLGKELEETAARIRAQWQERLAGEAEQARASLLKKIEADLAVSGEHLKGQLTEAARALASSAEQGMAAQIAALRQSIEQLLAQGRETASGLRADMEREVQRARSTRMEIEEALKRSEGYGARLEAASQTVAQDALRRFEALVASQSDAMNRKAEEVVGTIAERFRPALEATEQQALEHFRALVERVLAPRLDNAEQLTARLAATQQQAQQAVDTLRERLNQSSEKSFHEVVERTQSTLAQLRQDFDQASQAAIARFREEIEAKGTDASHTTFEALYKASEWYQKKAQTSMQTMLEKALDQATSSLREKAAEFSRLFASELEHYSRSYADHARGLLDESVREVVKGGREQLAETAATTAATFSDEVHQIAGRKLEETAAQLEERAGRVRSAMDGHAQQAFTSFEGRLTARIDRGVAQARQLLDGQFAALMQNWQARVDVQQKEWLDKLGRVTNEAVEHYKGRLESVSNSWLVASVTTLGQHGQTVIDSLSQKAEDRIRKTCSEALAGLAEMMRARLLNLSTDLRGSPPPEKK